MTQRRVVHNWPVRLARVFKLAVWTMCLSSLALHVAPQILWPRESPRYFYSIAASSVLTAIACTLAWGSIGSLMVVLAFDRQCFDREIALTAVAWLAGALAAR